MLFALMHGGGGPLPIEVGMFRAGAVLGIKEKTITFTTECLGKKVDVRLVCTAPEPIGKVVLMSIGVTLEGLQTEATQEVKEAIAARLKELFFRASIIKGQDGQLQIEIPLGMD